MARKAQDEAKTSFQGKSPFSPFYRLEPSSYYFCSATVVVVVVVLGKFTRDVNFILNNGSTELTAEQVQRPALEIEANLQPAATLHINHAPTSTLAKSLPETTLVQDGSVAL